MRSVRSIDVKSDRLTFFLSIFILWMERRNRGKKKEAIIDGINEKKKKRNIEANVKKDACQSPVADNRGYKTWLVTFLVRRHDAIDSVYRWNEGR